MISTLCKPYEAKLLLSDVDKSDARIIWQRAWQRAGNCRATYIGRVLGGLVALATYLVAMPIIFAYGNLARLLVLVATAYIGGYISGRLFRAQVALRYLRRELVAIGRCSKCGYDLEKRSSGRCPECGASVLDQRNAYGVTTD